MGSCGSFKNALSHGLTNLDLHVEEGIRAGKQKWSLMSLLIKVSSFYVAKYKMCHSSFFCCHQQCNWCFLVVLQLTASQL